mgnify:CR=1 FL=1
MLYSRALKQNANEISTIEASGDETVVIEDRAFSIED